MADDIERLDNDLHRLEESVSANFKAWQENYEKLDTVRWSNLDRQLGEVKGLLESIPVKVGEDITHINEKLERHEKAINFLRGAWAALMVCGTVLAFLLSHGGK